MAQPTHLNRNLPDLGGPFLYRNQDQDGEKASYSLETPYGFLLDLDFLKYVDDIESGQTLRKLPLNRKAKGPKQALGSSRSQTGGWTSTESLSSTTSEDGKPTFSPRPRIWGSSSEAASKQASVPMSPPPVIHLLPPPSPKALMRNTRVEKTLLETSKRLEREQLGLFDGGAVVTTKAPESPLSPLFPQNSPSSVPLTGESQTDLSLPLTGPVKMSPSNSGRSTPATAVTPAHLYHVRDQMAAALKHLKELEEQVKTIPVLEMKICRLKKEKEQLVAGLLEKSQAGEAFTFDFPPKSPSMEATNETLKDSPEATDNEPSKVRPSKIAELKKLTEKLSASEKTTKMNKGAGHFSRAEEHTHKSVGVGEEIDMDEAVFYYRCHRPCREVAVGWETEMKDAAVWVMESLLGVSAEAEQEIGLLQQTVQHQREVISMLEGHLKEATEELEELRVEVCLRMPKSQICKETMAQPETVEASTEAVPTTRCQAVGGHVEMVDKGILCSPQVACVGVGCDLQQRDIVSVKSGSKATRMDLEGESKVQEQNDNSAVAEPDGKGDEPIPEETEVSNRAVTEGCELPSLETKIVGADLELHFQFSAMEEENVQRESDKSSLGRAETGALKSIMKKRDGVSKVEAGSGRKSLQFVGVLNGEYESTSSEEEEEDQSPDKSSPLSSDSDAAGSTDTSDEEVLGNLEDSDPESPLPVVDARDKIQQCCDQEKAEEENAALEVKEKFELSPRMREACLVVRSSLGHKGGGAKTREVVTSTSLILQEWFRVSSQKSSLASQVAEHLLAFAEISPAILAHIVNLSDGNGNTALHYSVSHSNFDIVQLLLNTGVCNVNYQNKAGYTALMLAALAAVEQEEDMAVVRQLFAMGNVNAKASQAGQTALMLAVSHGRQEMVEALLACGADINLQDEEGSTALMCACEHGRAGTVRLLLSQATCDVSIVDNDGNDAVSIALEAGHRDIAALISTHLTQSAVLSPDQNGKSPRRQV
ncbi:KN motif and ankyrin repeat domain-containing protein 3 isoform X2 [Eublepharis macularius]|uniref:KN motif and ankyrin repeat domain-containing protein 3 isoform X2 n=1 Tax=Eublepharis macularius TaxID=481883 RepID=A0AA97JBX6_EUBMA|nr:KN motif and ankyrin repeat domain-containing protein 3 isoform X2 [Eublepharis macularius]